METEVKLAFKSKEDMMSIIKADWFSDYCLDVGDKEPVKLTNSYYDTPDRTLLKNGTSIRVRLCESGNESHYEHTVKYGGSVVNGLHQRYEWNVESDSPVFDISESRRSISASVFFSLVCLLRSSLARCFLRKYSLTGFCFSFCPSELLLCSSVLTCSW